MITFLKQSRRLETQEREMSGLSDTGNEQENNSHVLRFRAKLLYSAAL